MPKYHGPSLLAAVWFATIASTAPAGAAITTYTSSSAFHAALEGRADVTVQTFDTLPVDTLIPSGSKLDGIRYEFPLGRAGRIDNRFSVGSLSLALDEPPPPPPPAPAIPPFFVSGEVLQLEFDTAIDSIGIFFHSAPTPPGEFFITTDVGEAKSVGPYDVGTFHFVGLISDTLFTSATIGSIFRPPTGDRFGYTLDDLVTVTPVPGALILLASGLGALAAVRARKATGAIWSRRSSQHPGLPRP